MKTSVGTRLPFARKRMALCVAMLACLAGFLFTSPVLIATNKLQQRAKARALIQKALDISDFRAPGSPPFELRGTITIPLKNGKSASGSYLLDWVSPERWREEIHVANYSRIRVGGAGKYWQLRSIPYELMAFDTFTKGMNFAEHLRSTLLEPYWDKDSKAKILLNRKKLDGVSADCVKLGDDTKHFCFDTQSGRLLRNGSEEWEMTKYSEYQTFAEKLVPGALEMFALDHPVASFKLQSISRLDHPGENLFIPPQGAESWPTCDVFVRPKLIHEEHPSPPSGAEGTVLIYGILGVGGRFSDLKVIESPSPELGEAVLKSRQSAIYQPETCHGVAEKMEGIGMTTIVRH